MRAPEHNGRHRTVARVALALALAWALAGTAQARAAPTAKKKLPAIVFPVVGPATYRDDFGEPRGPRSHAGNDIVSRWRAPVVAVEAGKVTLWTSSASAGCMLYLHGASGATYLYIHLNDDRTAKRDNRGGCKPGVAYAPGLREGQRVRQGQLIGYVGDSGDAAGLEYHLHFEYHPRGKGAVSPYRLLRKAPKLLYAVPENELARGAAAAPALTLAGKVREVAPPGENGAPGTLTLAVTSARLSTGGKWAVRRQVTLALPSGTVLERRARGGELAPGARVLVDTAPVELSLATQLARPGALSAARVAIHS